MPIDDRPRRPRSRGGRAARRASPTGCCGACATTRRCAPTARSRSRSRTPALKLLEVDEHGFDEVDRKLLRTIIDKFGGGPVGVNTHRRGDQRREGRHRGHLRAVPDSDRLSGSDAARTRGDAARLRLFRARRAADEKGFTTVVTDATRNERTLALGGRPTTITSLATYVPPRVLTNADLEKMVDTTDEWILQRTGIRERHIVDPGVATSDLGKEAARRGDRARRPDARRHRPDRRRHGHAGHDVSEHGVPDAAQDRRAPRVGIRPERRLLGVHLLADRRPARSSRAARTITRWSSAPT